MSGVESIDRGNKALAWCLAGLVVALFIGANAHLIWVATASQPACVDHLTQGEVQPAQRMLSAAQSSCSPR